MRLESIKEHYNKYGYVHSYIDDNCCNQEWDEAHKSMGYLLQRLERYETTLQKITHTTTHLQAKFFAEEALKD